jgi:hypothetical protein
MRKSIFFISLLFILQGILVVYGQDIKHHSQPVHPGYADQDPLPIGYTGPAVVTQESHDTIKDKDGHYVRRKYKYFTIPLISFSYPYTCVNCENEHPSNHRKHTIENLDMKVKNSLKSIEGLEGSYDNFAVKFKTEHELSHEMTFAANELVFEITHHAPKGYMQKFNVALKADILVMLEVSHIRKSWLNRVLGRDYEWRITKINTKFRVDENPGAGELKKCPGESTTKGESQSSEPEDKEPKEFY